MNYGVGYGVNTNAIRSRPILTPGATENEMRDVINSTGLDPFRFVTLENLFNDLLNVKMPPDLAAT